MSWGCLASQAQRSLRVAWWLSFFPGMALVLAVLLFNLIADGLNDLLHRSSDRCDRKGRRHAGPIGGDATPRRASGQAAVAALVRHDRPAGMDLLPLTEHMSAAP